MLTWVVQKVWVKRAQRTGVNRDEVDRKIIMSFSSKYPALPINVCHFCLVWWVGAEEGWQNGL